MAIIPDRWLMRLLLVLAAVRPSQQIRDFNVSELAEYVLYGEVADPESRDVAAQAILRLGLDGAALQETLLHAGGEGSMWLARNLAPSQRIDGSTWKLVHWLRGSISGSDTSPPAYPHASCSHPVSAGRSLSTSPDSEEAAAEAVASLPRHVRETALREWLLESYSTQVAPDQVEVEVSINFFKIGSLDLKASSLSIPVWFRLSWVDPRLSYNASLWNISQVTFLADENTLENSEIWTPDVELYNNVQNLQTTMESQRAQGDSRGALWWSRAGIINGLCKFKGLRNYPLDKLSCALELGPWILSMATENVIFNKADGGYHFPRKSGEGQTSDTSGSSFQDYSIHDIRVSRSEQKYLCCAAPFSVLKYEVFIERSSNFYIAKLIAPQLIMAGLSYITYFLRANMGERLGFGMTLMLAVVATDIVATEFMPVCNEILLLSYITWLCFALCATALFESGIVLTMYSLTIIDIVQILPRCFGFLRSSALALDKRQALNAKAMRVSGFGGIRVSPHDSAPDAPSPSTRPEHENSEIRSATPPAEVSTSGAWSSPVPPGHTAPPKPPGQPWQMKYSSNSQAVKETRLRQQLYREAFYILDVNLSGRLEIAEVNNFGLFMMGDDWTEELLHLFMAEADVDSSGGLSFTEFSDFCERKVAFTEDSREITYLDDMIKGFLAFTRIRQEMVQARWQARAQNVDYVFRWLVPIFGFMPFFIILSHDFEASEGYS
mmetsp:Transcript_44539/g.80032  ORF Transcript_44539/g.80032 Transcript_44539/m.80032 type:complete len:723 (+) Transcript_44539:110-2278(+)